MSRADHSIQDTRRPTAPGTRRSKGTTTQKGLFADGIWHCNCSPRLPAEHFKVKKEGPNQGKWFYTCQQAEPKRCGFFLWDDAAKVREEAAVIGGQRTEPGVQEGWNAGRKAEQKMPGKGLFATSDGQLDTLDDDSTTASESSSPLRRLSRRAEGGHDTAASDTGRSNRTVIWPDLGAYDQPVGARVAGAVVPTTPHKALNSGVYATPATTGKRKLPWVDLEKDAELLDEEEEYVMLDTPSKPRTATPRAKDTMHPTTPAGAPTPAVAGPPSPLTRHKDALYDPVDDASSLTSEVLSTLTEIKLPAATMSSLRSVLTKHDLRTQGIERGRDISRLALKARDARITELQARIASLEADQEVKRGLGRTRQYAKIGGQNGG